MVALTFIAFNLLNIYKKYFNLFFNKLVSILLYNFKHNYIINFLK